MRAVTLVDGRPMQLISYGSGTAYSLVNRTTNMEVFFQGDDATRFSEEFDALGAANPHERTQTILCRMWADYAHIVTPRK